MTSATLVRVVVSPTHKFSADCTFASVAWSSVGLVLDTRLVEVEQRLIIENNN